MKLIVCERHGRWAVALRRELAGSGVRVWETRSLADCRTALLETPSAFVVVALSSKNIEGVLRMSAFTRRRCPESRLAVAADRSLAAHEIALREAGAAHFLCSPRQAGLLARLICRRFAQIPPPPQTPTDRIWAALPWK
jgi:hypothetical protein